MSIQSNFPNLKPSLLLDFANTKTLDPRITFTRGTSATYYDGRTTAMAEQNLLVPSVNIGTPYQSSANTITNNTGTAPDGTTTASLLVPNTTNTRHYCSSPYAASGSLNVPYTISLYAKPSGYNYIFVQFSGYPSSGGSRYGVTFNISTGAIESGGFSYSLNVASTSSTITSVGNGWYRITMTATLTNAANNPLCYVQSMPLNGSTYGNGGDGLPSYAGDGTNGAYIWGFQLEQRSSATAYTPTTTQPITNYIPVLLTAGGNQPRFDHNPVTGESLGLLVEEQRTNVASDSANLGNASAWPKASVNITSNANVAPDGSLSAINLVAATGNLDHDLYRYFNFSSVPYTLSVYAKYSGANLALSAGISNPWAGCVFDLQNGVAKTPQGSGMTCTASIQSVGNGWYRCSITFTATSSYPMYVIISTTNDVNATMGAYGFITYAGDGWSGVQLWGAQLEAGAFATSYIPTTGSSATRAVDAVSMTGANFSSWFNAGQGTIIYNTSTAKYIQDGRIFWQLDNGVSGYYQIFYASYAVAGNYYPPTIIPSGGTSTGPNLNAFTFDRTSTAVSTNGSTAVTSSGFTNDFSLAKRFIIASASVPVSKMAFYPQKLTNTNIQSLTA